MNPIDVLAPFTYEELDKEEQIGVDALRVRVPTGELGEVDWGMVSGKDFRSRGKRLFLSQSILRCVHGCHRDGDGL